MAHGLSCYAACGNLPGPGLEPMSPALAGGFLTTAPPSPKPNVLNVCLCTLTGWHQQGASEVWPGAGVKVGGGRGEI